MNDRLVTGNEAAEILGIAERSLRWHRWHGSSPVPFVKVGRRCFYRMSDIQAFISGLESRTCTTEVKG